MGVGTPQNGDLIQISHESLFSIGAVISSIENCWR